MQVENVARLSTVERFLYWIKERHNIYLRRKAGKEKPWTDDEILRRYRFCNVCRRDDRVSRWLLDNWYGPFFDHPNMLIAVVLARFLNLPRSLEAVEFPEVWNRRRIKRVLRQVKKSGATIFNAAYMVRGNDGPDKLASVLDYTIEPLVRRPPELDTCSMKKCWEQIEPRYGFGSFMAGQVVADLRWAVQGRWNDRRKWAPIGPGSQRGLNRLLGREVKAIIKQQTFVECLVGLISNYKGQLPLGLTRRMEAMDWQNCLCEFDKYERVLFEGRRLKRLYAGEPL